MSAALSIPPHRLSKNLTVATLSRLALGCGQCTPTRDGALVLRTGRFTGLSPDARYIVDDELTHPRVDWEKHQALSPDAYLKLQAHVAARFASGEVFEMDAHAGGDAGVRLRLLTTSPAHALFARHIFQSPRRASGQPLLTILHDPECLALPEQHGTRSGTFVVLSPSDQTILIGGTAHAGELKSAVFSLLAYLLPESGILPMHAAVNVDASGRSAVFFGSSGTGKTALSAVAQRFLLGDDAHGWSDRGVFNLEGGCYPKMLDLSHELAPLIWRAVHRPYVLFENVVVASRTGEVDFSDPSITENTRAAFPLSELEGVANVEFVEPPRHVFFLSAAPRAALPAVAGLSLDQAIDHFLNGYAATAFMPRPALDYANLLRARLERAGSELWLVNTGFAEGAHSGGRRLPIADARQTVSAILNASSPRP